MTQPGRKVIYIAGPITGVKHWKKAFNKAERELAKRGWDICSPVNVVADTIRETMAMELDFIARCADAVYMLKGWEVSLGAQAEWALARALGLKIIYEDAEQALATYGASQPSLPQAHSHPCLKHWNKS